jgi:adenylosuccinate synthase
MQKGKLNCIVDSAWGSSAKGAASTRLVDIYNINNVSTCNYANAGHTAIIDGLDGNVKFVAKVVPTSAILHKTKADRFSNLNLFVGPGSGFMIEQFNKELEQTGYKINDKLVKIHQRAVIMSQRHIDIESPNGSQSTERVSSTMSGSGAAFSEKSMRRPETTLASDVMSTLTPMQFVDTVRRTLSDGHSIMHEVSQGFALSVNHGTHYPYCTFRDCTPQQAYSDLGILPNMVGDVYLNVRTFPIRVGNNYRDGKQTGYSGDCMSDQHELTWDQIGREAGMPESEISVLAEKERTTVTKKIRRVFTFSWQLLKESASFCGATKQILNFPQYIDWSAYQMHGGRTQFNKLPIKVRKFIDKMEETAGIPVVMIGTGPNHNDYIFVD